LEIQDFIEQVCSQPSFFALLSKIEAKERKINLSNLAGSLKAIVAAGVIRRTKGTHLFVLNTIDDAAYFYADIYRLLNPAGTINGNESVENDTVLFFPSSFKKSCKYGREDMSNIVRRTQLIERIDNNANTLVVVAFPEALAETFPSGEAMNNNSIKITKGDKPGIDFVAEMFVSYGFIRSDFVYEPGQYAIRGGIIDVFSFSSNRPCRIEFFGDEIESIRIFDIDTQLSNKHIDSAVVTANIRNISTESRVHLLDRLPKDTIVWTENHKFTIDIINNLHNNDNGAAENSGLPILISGTTFRNSLAEQINIRFNAAASKNALRFDSIPQPAFNRKFELLANDIVAKNNEGYTVFIISDNPKQTLRLKSIFDSASKIAVRFVPVNMAVHEGFIDRKTRICCYTDHQIFHRYHRYGIRGGIDGGAAISVQDLTSIKTGDYIVHTDHGIGIFGGLVKVEVGGKIQEMVRIRYRDDDTILVNLHGMHRISKYRGSDGTPPKIHKPGSGVWLRLKQAAKKKIKDIAEELVALYAQRKTAEGFAFSPDSFLQHELEASFAYEDTPDQTKAAEAVKHDMERANPMDRLVCGDVGFGKTEVAIRAAFKAVVDGKQVALLVPTTILALQHYKSFRSRLDDFAVSVDFISRMKNGKELKTALANLERGKTDIIIGTHRLLSEDIKYKDLGLLIIDEEQRFGVVAKEKIRRRKINVDTLTLTATPIPRTLQFSLLGARDLSVINTPPPNRVPITTEVHTFSELIIKDAIEYELQRGGQVFFIHNVIKDIISIEKLVLQILPEARTVVVHGKTEGKKLEEIMTDFVDGLYDVLIATTIIESGLDIPNANTIIINQAQNFGLSELHQLRGRVGRSNRKAYCYLLAPPLVALTPDARRRLKAIEEFSELGSGFNVAMQDLDIRGAGNLLGGEQSGFIAEMGFETYQKILNEAVAELRNELPEKQEGFAGEWNFVSDTQLDSDIDAFLPDEYVSNMAEKLRLYRTIDNIEDDKSLFLFRNELADRFGPPPREAEELLQGVRLRHRAMKLGFERVMLKNGLMFLYFPADSQSPYYRSEIFHRILQFIQHDNAKYALKDSDSKLRLLVRNIKSHEEATNILDKIVVSD
jgi:transcription-repair coupling factor (superfamily II helicase)